MLLNGIIELVGYVINAPAEWKNAERLIAKDAAKRFERKPVNPYDYVKDNVPGRLRACEEDCSKPYLRMELRLNEIGHYLDLASHVTVDMVYPKCTAMLRSHGWTPIR